MQYSLLLIAQEAADAGVTEEDMEPFRAAFDLYGKSLEAAGVLVHADVLQPVASSTTVAVRDGELTVHDGPFADTKEKLGGVFVVDVPDLDAAIDWAGKCPGARYGTIEVRPSAIRFVDGQWTS
jgi:hypothetical protein